VDVPQAQAALQQAADSVNGSALPLDITAPDAASSLQAHVSQYGAFDVVVHNAGITRDKTIAKMSEAAWHSVLAVNLQAPLCLSDALLDGQGLNAGGRIVCVSSISGIAGNLGQSNYATSKAGVIGLVQGLAPRAATQQVTVNAVAPGFIETQMTARIPLMIREAGRRMNSLSQGGQPIDVAETIAWLAHPASGGVNGQVVRVCGQSLLGA
jgi:3-oxoacyl-[acyl-carrier protein] reductase